MAKRYFSSVAVLAAVVCLSGSLLGQVGPGGAVGGVVGGTRPATRPTTLGSNLPPGPVAPAVPLVLASTFKPVAADPIERKDFLTKPHPVEKSITSATAMMVIMGPDHMEVGVTSDVIAAVASGSRQGKVSSAVFITKQAMVGPQMKTSFDEAVRAVQVRYSTWEPAVIEFNFGDKYTPHEGGSAGTCFAVMLLSELEGFDIDPKCAVTGDISANWKVKKIGGLGAKVRGATADKCLYAGVPAENHDQIGDMSLMFGDASLREIQVFSLETLQDAVALLRTDRSPQMVEAMKEFTELQPKMKAGRATLSQPAIQKVLENIIALAPNHESAKWLLEIGKGKASRFLSPGFAAEQIFNILDQYSGILSGDEDVTRTTVTPAMTASARKQLTQLSGITPTELQPLMVDARKIVEACENIALKQAKPDILAAARKSFITHYEALRTDKAFVEKLMRG